MRKILKRNKADRGFSLMELMVAIGLVGIMAAIATPSFIRWLPDYYLKSAARDLRSNLQLAKMSAIKSGTYFTITFNQAVGGETFDYVIFQDTDNDLELDSSEAAGIIRRVKWTDYRGVSATGNNFVGNDDGLPAVAFRSDGLPRNNTGGLGMGTVSIANTNSSTGNIVMSVAGNIRVEIVIH